MSDADVDDDGQFTVELVREDGSSDVLEVAADETILSATDPTDIDLRYGCREGRCVSCTGLLLEGEIEYTTDPAALNDAQREDGFVLLCISRPASDCSVRVGKSVLGAAFPNLWQTETSVDSDLIEFEQARKELKAIDGVTVSEDHLEDMRGAMAYFDNLHEVREAYERALETTTEKRYH
ncbi:2Fe-2S iron-sulfur cluster-binding protein [Haloarculaceae archaeon H-GB2-1]|nr:2Fe-2S iron-sulfur cluster-binding protein [Haloarculaceae archaeon H-GB1-1]MEA5385764.1 2Fe-2S iron-sulfur cluster-binding protein [Haloarculaceae archaeon H-GB11]MEA5407268.1 2Fe-2S iron-sulfur cluster-binding protein [Haloarculaceae archaeon H-GB2-1]